MEGEKCFNGALKQDMYFQSFLNSSLSENRQDCALFCKNVIAITPIRLEYFEKIEHISYINYCEF